MGDECHSVGRCGVGYFGERRAREKTEAQLLAFCQTVDKLSKWSARNWSKVCEEPLGGIDETVAKHNVWPLMFCSWAAVRWGRATDSWQLIQQPVLDRPY